jgi:hypothetical protein
VFVNYDLAAAAIAIVPTTERFDVQLPASPTARTKKP